MVPFLIVSCTGGYLITEDQLAQIKIGTSTQEDVRKVLGEPMSVSKSTDSENSPESWVYPLSKYASDPNTGVPPIGVVGAPISRARRKTTEVEIGFDEKGIVNSIKERRPPQ
ncbi:MAG: outer membrane protein assembly factor BamE [Nitrospirota bacterium]|nr:MAG: outer membrane protein assembly factor BamE [Nitrospirota bacterium]